MNGNLVALVLGELAFLAFVLWLAVQFLREKARLRADLQKGVLDRFASAQEFVAFLETESGRRFEAALAGRPLAPLTRILVSLRAGVVLLALGLGLATAWGLLRDPDLLVAAAVALALGAGFLAAAAASHRLCRRWGLVPGQDGGPQSRA